MQCPACGTVNEAGRKFCHECGEKLAATCPSCGSANTPGARFCGECGTKLANGDGAPAGARAGGLNSGRAVGAAAAPVAERRLVSILFADLVGFTAIAEGRDAETVRELLSSYFDLARDVITRHGGTVEKFIGDAVMAVWGAPVAREDDAERAVRAGLELVDAVRALGPEVRARAGVLTGEAAVTLGATDQGMVAGDLVNTASRLQSVAAPGTVLVGEATQRATSQAIAYEPAGDQVLKGKDAPVAAWRALRIVAERSGRGRSDRLEAPFVGRDAELRLLKDLFHATSKERRVRLVSITGQAGIGKSRLAWEFEKYVDGVVERVMWHDGRSPAYGEGITFWALGEMVRSRAGLAETDDAETTRARIAAMLDEFVPDETECRWIEPALLALLGVDEAPLGGRDELFRAWRTFFERVAGTGTVALVFEDLHWADGGLLDFIDHLLEWSRGVPILIITLARPDLLVRRPDWGAGRRNFLALGLEALDDDAMRELLAGLVPGLPAASVRSIIDRADGIPLYAVEMVRMLVGDGRLREVDGRYEPVGELGELAVPETLQALIAARLDGLDAGDRTLLQDAAVLGQSFTIAALAAVNGGTEEAIGARLHDLAGMELVEQLIDPRSPERGQYLFVQALIREVAYGTLAKRDRAVAPSGGRALLRVARRGRAGRSPRDPLRRRVRGGPRGAGGRCARGPGTAGARRGRRPGDGPGLAGAGHDVPDAGRPPSRPIRRSARTSSSGSAARRRRRHDPRSPSPISRRRSRSVGASATSRPPTGRPSGWRRGTCRVVSSRRPRRCSNRRSPTARATRTKPDMAAILGAAVARPSARAASARGGRARRSGARDR